MRREDLTTYRGREHAKAKHDLLRSYVERYVMILGRAGVRRLVFVDAFAGPWQSGAEDLSDTSFGISLKVLKRCAEDLEEKFNRRPEIRALWVEEDKGAFDRLSEAATKGSDSRVSVTARQGRFQDLIGYIQEFVGNDAYAFIFVDPKGYRELIEPAVLGPLLRLPRAELLINYMWSYIKYGFGRACEPGHLKNLRALYGAGTDRLLEIDDPAERCREALAAYEANLKLQCGKDGRDRLRVLSYPILSTQGKRHPKYYLVHTTHSPTGLVKFAEECERAESHQQLIFQLARVRRQEAKMGVVDMFGDFVTPEARTCEPETECWLKLLPAPGASLQVDEGVWADLLEAGRCLPSALLGGAKELLDQGIIINESARARARRKRFVDYAKREMVRRV